MIASLEHALENASAEMEALEFEVRRSGDVALKWSGPLSLSQAAQQAGGGVYILTQNGRPVYVGKASDFKDRVGARAEHLRQAAAKGYQFWLGNISGGGDSRRRAAEHGLIRYLTAHARQRFPLTNQQSIRPFRAGAKGFRIRHQGKVPGFLRSPIQVKSGATYESFESAIEQAAQELEAFSPAIP